MVERECFLTFTNQSPLLAMLMSTSLASWALSRTDIVGFLLQISLELERTSNKRQTSLSHFYWAIFRSLIQCACVEISREAVQVNFCSRIFSRSYRRFLCDLESLFSACLFLWFVVLLKCSMLCEVNTNATKTF